ncbi:linear amide C-N hydrolase [bacterium]|nr:linear amide C-N hydrolase [bacterium]
MAGTATGGAPGGELIRIARSSMRALAAGLLMLVIGGVGSTRACTAIGVEGPAGVYLGRNLDWELGDGLIVVHPRDPTRGAIYLSVTMNQFGADLPLGGMNEVGLAVEELSYPPARPPEPGGRPTIDEFALIQYLLDRCATVDAALRAVDRLAVVRRWAGLHYILADRTGDAAVLEFLDGRTVVHRGADLPHRVLTNDTYARSREYLARHVGFGGDRHETDGPGSPERFVRAARMAVAWPADPADGGDGVFRILDEVRQHDTRWSIVHDLARLTIDVRVAGGPPPRRIDVAAWAGRDPTAPVVRDLMGTVAPHATDAWIAWTPAIEARLRERVAVALGTDVATAHEAAEAARRSPLPPVAVPELELLHVQNAGVEIHAGRHVVLVDALLDLTVAPGQPPRLHDHLTTDRLDDLVHGRAPFTPADAIFITHGHDDHHDAAIARRYDDRQRPQGIVHPAGMARAGLSGAVAWSRAAPTGRGAAGPVRFTSLSLRHAGDDGPEAAMPHLGFVIHLGPWNVIHLGDAGPSPANLQILDGLALPGRTILLAPSWFLTDARGLAWLETQRLADEVVLLHANRGNLDDLTGRLHDRPSRSPQIMLVTERFQRFRFSFASR